MFDILTKYKDNGHFFFNPTDDLRLVCNAPTDKSGIYIVYALRKGKVELMYIGRSGKVEDDGTVFVRRTGLGGIKDRIVNGKQFGGRRRISWPNKMAEENIEALDIYWYVTHTDRYVHCPKGVKNELLQDHVDMHGEFPVWN